MKANDIRQSFIDFFKDKNHQEISSSPLVPQNDPSLLFVNSGMVQFKDIFTGKENPTYPTAVTSQKCLRAGGKHNDLDNVGYTARHHTFFEMLGNFSFGDYFKEQAILNSWQLVTDVFALDKEKLLVTVYHEDDVAANLWKKIAGLSDEKIIRIKTSDNFWQMGDVGPCGPCSEIFYDHGDHIFGGPPGSVDEDGDRFIEIWNLVFMQYEKFKDGENYQQIELPKPSIDTGMGLERIAAVLQNKHNNYDVDHMRALIIAAGELTKQHPDGELSASLRVIADHLRACAFLIADGVLPSNEGRGYVLRRIMRRGMRHAFKCGAKEPIFHQLVDVLISEMGGHYSELSRARDLITMSLKNEEEKFSALLSRGMKQLHQMLEKTKDNGVLSGDDAFMLYDTYGFPADLTADILREQHKTIDMDAFEQEMNAQRQRARQAWVGTGDSENEALWFGIYDKVGASEFLGYAQEISMGKIQAIIKDKQEVKILKQGEKGYIITNQTPFYGESGGQVGDHGVIEDDDGNRFIVTDTQKKANGLFVHYGEMRKGEYHVGGEIRLKIDKKRRQSIRAHHSATHLLHTALREILGNHVTQKGSLVNDDYLRFDFAHHQALSDDEIQQVEILVNQHIIGNSDVTTRLMACEDAINAGAMALFGEKYADEVRVVSMGETQYDKAWSVELCGGTHVQQTGDIGGFKIISEGSVAGGVRRIEAVCGIANLTHHQQQQSLLDDLAKRLNVKKNDILQRVDQIYQERKNLEQENQQLKRQIALNGNSNNNDNGGDSENINNINVTFRQLQNIPAKELRNMAEELLKQQQGNDAIVVIFTVNEEKVSLVAAVSQSLCDNISAVDLVKSAAEIVGGKGGGGRTDMAQAGGDNPDKIDDAITALRDIINK